SEADIRALNPNVIYANLNCFSDTVWKERPGWAPCAEDITGLSVRNGSLEQPKNLNGVPLDYFPGFILALGTLRAIAQRLKEGGGYKVTTSLTRGAQYLHECADLCERETRAVHTSSVAVRSRTRSGTACSSTSRAAPRAASAASPRPRS
ncbi:MAG: CoA transferase, partial [Oscillospiraceae bacterium]